MSTELYYSINVGTMGVMQDISFDISSLTINEENGKPDQLTIEISDYFKSFTNALQAGLEIEVDLGTTDDHSLLFKGVIYKVEGEFPQDGPSAMRVVAYDNSMKMGLCKYNRRWRDKSLSQIVSDIGKEYFGMLGVSVDVEGDPMFEGNGIRQVEETDLAFMLRLARQYACEMYVEVDEIGLETLHFKSQKAIMSGDPLLTVYHGRCGVEQRLLSFNANTDIANIELPRQFIGMDYDEGTVTEMATGEVGEGGEAGDDFADENFTAFMTESPTRVTRIMGLQAVAGSTPDKVREALGEARREATPTLTTSDKLDIIRQNQFGTRVNGMQGSGLMHGNQRLHAQATINIGDVGGQYSGVWYLSQVRHKLNREGYQTEFECQR